MKAPLSIIGCALIFASTLWVKASALDALNLPGRATENAAAGHDSRQCAGEPCDAVARGRRAFSDGQLEGLQTNGRACADCHMPTDNFQLSPASVEARYQLLQRQRQGNSRADDPLFRPIDADDFRTNGDQASDFSNLRENALVRVTFPLPSNMRLIDPATGAPSGETFVDIWRSVPTVNDVALTGPDGGNPWMRDPNRSGGYQLDARFGTLQEQALGALVNHAQAENAPSQQLLDDLAAFQRVLFTNHRVQALADAIREGSGSLPDPDPRLDVLEQEGKVVFERACAQCHGGPGQSTTFAPIVRFHDIVSQCPRPVHPAGAFSFEACGPQLARNARTYEITMPNGTKVRRTSSDPGRALLTGVVGGPPPLDDWNKFDVPGLRGIRNTAPYFHNNSAESLEAVVDHYIEFFKFVRTNALPGVFPPIASTDGQHFDRIPLPEERAALLAYLRKL